MLTFSVLHLGDHNIHGGVAEFSGDDAYRELSKSTRDALSRSDIPGVIRLIDQGFQGQTYSLKNLFRDEQRQVMGEVIEATLAESESSYRQIYAQQAPLVRFMRDCRIPIPNEMRATAEVALNDLLRHALEIPVLDLSEIHSLLEDVRIADAPLHAAALEMILRRNLEHSCQDFYDNPRELAALRKCRQAVEAAKTLPLSLVLWSIQNRCYAVLDQIYPEMKDAGQLEWRAEFEQLCWLLSLRV